MAATRRSHKVLYPKWQEVVQTMNGLTSKWDRWLSGWKGKERLYKVGRTWLN